MSTLLEQASLVMIPSGYAEDIVYSVIPQSGAGDLSFTRASNGTRVNSAGLVEVCPWNLVQQSETFSNAFWSVDNGSITANSTTAPNGTTTADTLTRNASTAYLYNGAFNLGIGEFTQSIYAKANASSSIRLEFVTGAFGRGAACIFDLSNGTAGTLTIYGGVSGFTATIESVGNGWYRCSIGGTITIADTYYYEISITTGSIYIWGAQINVGSTAKPYFPTTDRLNVPRLTYQNGGGGCPSLLLEKQSTNVLTYSEQFDNAIWTKRNSTISANAITSPDGTTNADKIQEDTSNDRHDIYQDISAVSGTTYTQSIFAKKGERDYIFMSFGSSQISSANSFFNLNTGVVVSSPSGITSTITDMGNGWYRCTSTGTAVSSGLAYLVTGPSNNGTGISYQGVSGNGVFIWGAQIEASSYATSYIPSTSSSATRVRDFATTNNISSLFGSTEGSFFIQMSYDNTNPDGAIPLFLRSSSNAAYNYATYLQFGGNTVQFYVYNSGSSQVSITSSAIYTTGQTLKISFAYKQNDFVIYVNGVLIGYQTSGNISSNLAFIDLGTYNQVASTYQYNGVIGETILFPTRLTNSELAQLTGNQNYTINQAYASYGVASESPNCVQP